MIGSLVRKGFLVTAAILAAVSLAGGVLYLIRHLSVDSGGTAMQIGVGVVVIASGLAISAGLWAGRRSKQSGRGLIVAGAVPAAICFWWTGVVPIAALSIAFFSVHKAGNKHEGRLLFSSGRRLGAWFISMPKRVRLSLAIAIALTLIGMASGAAIHFGLFSPHPQETLDAFNAVYGTAGTRIDICNTCHTSGRNTNSYGTDLKSRFRVLTSSGGGDMTREESLQQFRATMKAIEGDDSDQDGASHIDEIKARTFPGDAPDHPAEQ